MDILPALEELPTEVQLRIARTIADPVHPEHVYHLTYTCTTLCESLLPLLVLLRRKHESIAALCEHCGTSIRRMLRDLHNPKGAAQGLWWDFSGEAKRYNIACGSPLSELRDHSSGICNLVSSGAMTQLSALRLNGNQLGDAGVTALSKACADGALASCRVLGLDSNQIGDAGMQAFSAALTGGALASVDILQLSNNNVGDVGMRAFSKALGGGALAKLEVLGLARNQIGDAGMGALSGALASGAQTSVTRLAIDNNQIGDAGMVVLVDVLGEALAQLTLLILHGNNVSDVGTQAISTALAGGAFASLESLYVDEGPVGAQHPALQAACENREVTLNPGW
jgi:hypothetical protein